MDTAGSGEAALALLEQKECDGYDGVLLDLMMPGLDGLETCRRIRRLAGYERVPVIALSASDSPADRLQCYKAGMNGHIAKPIDEQQLWQVLADCLHPQPVVNAEFLSRLQQRLPEDRFAALMQMTLSSCEEWQQHFAVLAESGKGQALRELAHNMAGTAGQAGLEGLSEQARLISAALKEQDEQRALKLASQVPVLVKATAARLKAEFGVQGQTD
ncbi:response regulator [Oceanimonas baumannii]|uniref:Response regulator receiver domain-containing protein n=1 Tax=Oceanimonas baumannii TaxID=129578 RepID=A0ABY2EVL3_9GAMM|nr:response regulator [Oceanimonas baumannii]TDW56373.1 response regulator receiver domain-containing protein [Oceanimonas baumannii]